MHNLLHVNRKAYQTILSTNDLSSNLTGNVFWYRTEIPLVTDENGHYLNFAWHENLLNPTTSSQITLLSD